MLYTEFETRAIEARPRRHLKQAAFEAREAARAHLARLYVRKAVRLEVVAASGLQSRLPAGLVRKVISFAA